MVDMDSADILSTLHSLYSMTFTAIGEKFCFIYCTLDNVRFLIRVYRPKKFLTDYANTFPVIFLE